MSEILLNTIVEKVNAQEKKISDMQPALKDVPRNTAEIERVKKEMQEIKTSIQDISFPVKEMQELSDQLEESIRLLRQPVTDKVLHHHYVPKVIWIATGLFIVLALVCAGWYATANKLDQYKENDIKYRYLKVNNSPPLRQLLNITDSLYRNDENFRSYVIQVEEDFMKRIELEQSIIERENEITRLKEKIK